MKVLVCHGPRDVQIVDKPHPNIQYPQDAICVLHLLLYVALTCIFIMVQYKEWNQDKPSIP
jgi:hypothetical protein